MGNEIRRQTESPLVHYLMKVCQPTRSTRETAARRVVSSRPRWSSEPHFAGGRSGAAAVSHVDLWRCSSLNPLHGVSTLFSFFIFLQFLPHGEHKQTRGVFFFAALLKRQPALFLIRSRSLTIAKCRLFKKKNKKTSLARLSSWCLLWGSGLVLAAERLRPPVVNTQRKKKMLR